jgi:phenylacetate-coenzyme A ligase PaaK-like adenylate-forming protein
MNIRMLANVVRARAALRSHDHWSRGELAAQQARSLQAVRVHATAHSPFYREIHHGLDDAPLSELPVVTKQQLMERFDDVVTDRAIRLADVEAYLDRAVATDVFRDRYRVTATGGTTGRRGVFLANAVEWRTVLASYSRAYDWAGVRVGLTNHFRMAVVSSRNPSHQSAIVGASVASRFVPTLRLDATQPLVEIVRDLNAFRPDALVGYASLLGVLAEERRAGRLAITPKGIFSASEVLTDDIRARLRAAFGVAATNVYAATEAAGIASECRQRRLHLYEDLVIAEIVNEQNQPVGSREYGAKLLVTVLFARTQPLIRYELSDRVQRLDGACVDGLPFGLIGGIEGREEEVLTLSGARVHPNVFHSALQALPVSGWQVVEDEGSLRVLLARPFGPIVESDVAAGIASQLGLVGAHGVQIDVAVVPEIPRTRLGKAPLIRRATQRPRDGPR